MRTAESGRHENLDRQIGALRAERCDAIFREKASGRSTKPAGARESHR
jgi:hypothetical protein